MVRERQAPDDVPEVPLPDGDPVHLPALLAESLGIGSTKRPGGSSPRAACA